MGLVEPDGTWEHCGGKLRFVDSSGSIIADQGAQITRYYAWYSNNMRGQRQRVHNDGVPCVSLLPPSTPPPPAKLPSKQWRDLML